MGWPRVDGLRTMELGSEGAMRAELNGLVLAGAMAFSGSLFPAAITLVLVCVVLLGQRLR